MATKTKTTTKNATKKVNKPNVAKKVNSSLINASIAAINTTIDNGEKWQKLASKLIKKSEKVRQQQINMVFDTAEAVKGQFKTGTDRVKDLVGFDAELVEKAKDMAMNNPVSKKVVEIVEDITEKVNENPMVQKAEKATEDLKNMGIAKYKELKEDVLEQASKIIDKGEAMIEEAKAEPKAKVTPKTTVKKATTKKSVARKTTVTKAKATKTIAKVAPKKTVAKKTTLTKAKATKTVAKAAPNKTIVPTEEVRAVKTVAPAKKVALAEVKAEVKK